MEWLEQNIDAYRIVAEVLTELRETVKNGLEAKYGSTWYQDGLPEGLLDRLVAAKEREQAIDWYESQYQQVMDYAVFPDLLEILEENAETFPGILGLAPSAALLHARFLELEVMRAKLGRTRPISETELSFLGTFHLRFRRAMRKKENTQRAVGDPASEIRPAAGTPGKRSGKPSSAPIAVELTEDEDGNVTAVEASVVKPVEDMKPGPPKRPVQTSAGQGDRQEQEPQPKPTPAPEPESDAPTDEDNGGFEGGPKKLARALDDNNHAAVLRQLYREVTAIAEGIWTDDVIPAPLVWEQVTAHDWYELNFSRFGMQPLSEFYDVISKVDKKTSAGIAKGELQEFLKEVNFAKILLSLRDMFQNNNI
ncbi:MAG: hypothetical protein ACC742_02235 [Thermoanaerobaculales bacterium]